MLKKLSIKHLIIFPVLVLAGFMLSGCKPAYDQGPVAPQPWKPHHPVNFTCYSKNMKTKKMYWYSGPSKRKSAKRVVQICQKNNPMTKHRCIFKYCK